MIVSEILTACQQQKALNTPAKKTRVRGCTPEAMMLFQLSCSLWRRRSQEQVWQEISSELTELHPRLPDTRLCSAALSRQRERLGSEPFRQLIERCCQPLCDQQTPGAFYHHLRVMAVDGTFFDAPDTPENARAFGRARNQYGQGAYPQARAVLLMEVGSRAIMNVSLGNFHRSEMHGVVDLLPSLRPGMLLLGDRGIFSLFVAERVSQLGADILFRIKKNQLLTIEKRCSDGSYLTTVSPSSSSHYRASEPQTLRVIEYQVSDARCGKPGEIFRLVTSLLDETLYPMQELIALYRQRWGIELMIREQKVTLQEQKRVVRSRKPDGVKQELYALFLTHYAVRGWMKEAASLIQEDPRRISCSNAIEQVRRGVRRSMIYAPENQEHLHTRMVFHISQEGVRQEKMRMNYREVKRVHSKYKPKKRERKAPRAFEKEETYLSFVETVIREQAELDKEKPSGKPAREAIPKHSAMA
ncbi:IS4 family transposase [Dictyobacter arantiisoli]|uniref:IS4 family transposase n=1 Tax=Dictyobacter arantiisoli TaxID=2014874 RepID=A0A5A5TFB5_9CHLR|nr:IS4 family transposase [Dictyobacter arantiisoli]